MSTAQKRYGLGEPEEAFKQRKKTDSGKGGDLGRINR